MRKMFLCMLVVTAVSTGFVSVSGAMEAYLWVDGAPGEVALNEPAYKDWIAVQSFSWGHKLQPSGTTSSPRVQFDVLSIVKFLDKASSPLALSCANGRPIPRVVLELRGGPGQKPFEKIELQQVLVTSYDMESPPSQPLSTLPRPIEKVSFTFARILWTYTVLDATGTPRAEVKSGWDIGSLKGM